MVSLLNTQEQQQPDVLFEEPEQLTSEDETPLFEEDNETPPVLQSEEQQELTAELATLAVPSPQGVSFEEEVEQNKQIIAQGDENVLREQAALRSFEEKTLAMDEQAFEEMQLGQKENAQELLEQQFTLTEAFLKRKSNAGSHDLEKRAVEAIQNREMIADKDFGSTQLERFQFDLGSTLDVAGKELTKTLIFQRFLDEWAEERAAEGKRSFIESARDFGAIAIIPFYEVTGRLDVSPKVDGKRGFNLRPGKVIRERVEALFGIDDIDEFERTTADLFEQIRTKPGVFGSNETLSEFIIDDFRRGTVGTGNVILTDLTAALDSTIILGAFGKLIGGGVSSLGSAARITRARKVSTTLSSKTILKQIRKPGVPAPKTTDKVVDAVEDILPDALTVKKGIQTDPEGVRLSGELSEKLDDIARIGDDLSDISVQGRLSPKQQQELVSKKIEQLEEQKKGLAVADFKTETDPVTKLTSVVTLIGKRKTAEGFVSQAAAKGAATRMGFKDAEVVEDGGRFFIKQTDVVEELTTGGFPLIRRPDNSIEVIPAPGPVPALRNPSLLIPEDLARRRTEAALASIEFRDKIITPLQKEINKLGKKDIKALNAVMTIGRNERRWFNIDEFALQWEKVTGKDPSEQAFVAYSAARRGSEIDYAIHNNQMFTDLARRGAKVITIKDLPEGFQAENLVAFELKRSPEQLKKTRLLDVETGVVRTGKETVPEGVVDDFAEKIASGNYKAFVLKEPQILNGEPVHRVLVPVSGVTESPLPRIALGNVAGGHLLRRTKWFAKQPNIGTYNDGTHFVLGPRTLGTARTEVEMRSWVNSVNEGLRAFREFQANKNLFPSVQNALAKVQVRRILQETPLESLENLESMIRKNKIDPNRDLEVVFDRGLPDFYLNEKNINRPDVDNLFADVTGDPLDGTLQWLNSTGRDFFGKRTEGLLSPHEEADVVLSPLASVRKGLEHAAKTHAFDNFFNRSIEEWVRVASEFIDTSSIAGKTDARDIFFNARINKQVQIKNPEVFEKLETNREIIKRTLGMQTVTQERFSTVKRNLARFIGSKGGKLGLKAVKFSEDILSNNPINAVNALMFDSFMGFLDIGQLFVQSQTLAVALAASPKFGAQALGMFPAMRWLMVNKSDNLLDFIAKNAKAIHGQSPDDFKDMIKAFRDSRFSAVAGEIAQLDNHSNSIGSSGVVFRLNQARRGARLFFNEAERWNRMVAWQIAWKETRQKFPKLSIKDELFKATVRKRTDDFSLNMTSINNSRIQSGIFSPMTRFLGYQFRLTEALLPRQFGGSTAFSDAAKWRMRMSQILLYGAAGLPFGRRISTLAEMLIEDATGERPDQVTTKAIESGVLDLLLFLLTGGDVDTDFAERAGFGRGLDFLFEKAGNGEMNSVLEVFGGPAFSFGKSYMESVNRVLTYFKGTRGPLDLSPEDAEFALNELVTRHILSLKRANKAMMIWRFGQVLNPRTGQPMFEATKLEALAAFLGIPLAEETMKREFFDQLRDRGDEISDVGSLLAKLDRQAFDVLGQGDFEKAERIRNQAAVLLSSYADDPLFQQQVATFATNNLGFSKTEWQALLERIQSRLGPEELPPQDIRFEE